MRPRTMLAAIAATALSVTGCSTASLDEGKSAIEARDAYVDTSVLDAGGHVDATVFRTPAEMATEFSVVASGEVVAIRDGYELLERGTVEEGYDVRERTVVLAVRVTELYKGSKDDLDAEGTLYVSLSRGAQQEGLADDEGGPSTIIALSDFEEAIPLGSEVVVIANPVAHHEDAYLDVIDEDRGVGDGGLLLSGLHPQSLTFPTSETATSTWRHESFEDVETQLAGALG